MDCRAMKLRNNVCVNLVEMGLEDLYSSNDVPHLKHCPSFLDFSGSWIDGSEERDAITKVCVEFNEDRL